MKYKDIEEVAQMLQKRGAKFHRSQKEIDMSRPKTGVVGIDSLGKLEFFRRQGYQIVLPEVQMNPKKGYRGLLRP